MKRRTALVPLVVLLVAGLVVGLLSLLAPTVHWDRWDNVQITGRLVDPESRKPHAGVRITTLRRPEDADDGLRARQTLAQRQLDMIAEDGDRGHDTSGRCPGSTGLTTSDHDGQFAFCVRIGYGGTDWGWFFSSKSREPPSFHGVKALLLEWPDGRRAMVDATDGEWTVVGRRDAMLKMGTVRLPSP